MRALRAGLIYWLPLIAWLAVIHNLSSIPGRYLPHTSIPHADKAFHMAEYFVLGVLAIRAFDKSYRKVGLAKIAVLAIIISLCYGGFDELYQRSVAGRACDPLDLLADCAGACFGILIYIYDRERTGGKLAADKAV